MGLSDIKFLDDQEPHLINYENNYIVELNLQSAGMTESYHVLGKKLPLLANVIMYGTGKEILDYVTNHDISYKDYRVTSNKSKGKFLLVTCYDREFAIKHFDKVVILIEPGWVEPFLFQWDTKIIPKNGFNIKYIISRISPQFPEQGKRKPNNGYGIFFQLKDTKEDNPTNGVNVESLDLINNYDIDWD